MQERTNERVKERTKERQNERTNERRTDQRTELTNEQSNEQTKKKTNDKNKLNKTNEWLESMNGSVTQRTNQERLIDWLILLYFVINREHSGP